MAHGRRNTTAGLPTFNRSASKSPKPHKSSVDSLTPTPPTTSQSTPRLRTNAEMNNDYRVVIFGGGGVGKSSLVTRFIKGTFKENYVPTIEDTYREIINCDKSVCTLLITDTAGSHHFPAMETLSISRGNAFILVYSITSKQSIEEVKPYYEKIQTIKGDLQAVPVYLVGNKCDEIERNVSVKDGKDLAKTLGCNFLETSAKNNFNVKELFQRLLDMDVHRNLTLKSEPEQKSKLNRRMVSNKMVSKCVIS